MEVEANRAVNIQKRLIATLLVMALALFIFIFTCSFFSTAYPLIPLFFFFLTVILKSLLRADRIRHKWALTPTMTKELLGHEAFITGMFFLSGVAASFVGYHIHRYPLVAFIMVLSSGITLTGAMFIYFFDDKQLYAYYEVQS